MVDLDPAPFLHNRCAFGRGRTRRFQKALIVGNTAVLSLSSLFPSPQVRRLWSHPNAAVFILVVDLVGILAQVAVERSEEHTSELQSHLNIVCRLLLEKKKTSTLTLQTLPYYTSPPAFST